MPMLNAVPQAAAKGPDSADLQASRKALESALPAALKDPVNRVVTAGMKLLYSTGPTQQKVQATYDAVAKGGFQPQQIANGMVNLLGMIVMGSKGKAPLEAIYPAGVILLTYVMEDLQKTRGLKVTDELVKTTGMLMKQAFVKAFGGQQQAPGAQPGMPPQGMPPAGASPMMPPSAPQPLLNQGA